MGRNSDTVAATNPGKHGNMPPLPVMLSQLQAGLTVSDIARIHGVSSSGVYAAIRKYGIDISALRTFKDRKADTLAHIQMLVTSAMPGKVENTSLRDLATTFNILHNAERLERGQSTNNLSVTALLEQAGELDTTIARLEEQLRGATGAPPPDAETVEPEPVEATE